MKKTISAGFKGFWIHILIWFLFICYEVVAVGLMVGAFGHPVNYISHYLITIGVFYLSALLVLPFAFKLKAHMLWRAPLGVALLFLIFLLANYYTDLLMIDWHFANRSEGFSLTWAYSSKILYRWIYVFGFSAAYFFLKNYLVERDRAEEMEKQRLERVIEEERIKQALSKAQNDFLKAQINPHFLFNTLDFIYHSISELSQEASQAVMTLSEMMRYAVDSGDLDDTVSLGEEIEQIEKLIYLYQLRKNMELKVMSYFSDQAMGLRFIPLVLLTLVENIFKHGDVGHALHEIRIIAVVEDGELVIETSNAVNLIRSGAGGTNAGLKNIGQRLRFAYGNDIGFHFGREGELFVTRIAVPVSRILHQGERRELLTTNLN
ncbi:sensor histidine kinase [Pedobacter kyonggii]|nr:histidine kinase [Pedobacter kyonggii]